MESISDIDGYSAAISTPMSVLVFVLGALIGSFLNVVIYRMPEGQSIVRPRSHCPHCGDMIPSWLNVPILSWIALRGRCRSCKAPISIRYPIIELLTALLFLACFTRFGLSVATIAGILLVAGLIVITFVDIDHWEIPDEISLPGIVIGCAIRPFAFHAPWWDGLLGAAIGAGLLWLIRAVFFLVRKKEGMGLGDLKLLAMIGAFLGPRGLIVTMFVASTAGTIIGLTTIVVAKIKGDEEEAAPEPPPSEQPSQEKEGDGDEDDWTPPKYALPFGPFLALGALAELFFGDRIIALLFGGVV